MVRLMNYELNSGMSIASSTVLCPLSWSLPPIDRIVRFVSFCFLSQTSASPLITTSFLSDRLYALYTQLEKYDTFTSRIMRVPTNS